ncbi:hypothetical protein [Candidatus Nanohalobium constans]|uniref:Uncharacterized protein n=1 Tax=Candidatus Nanohalobium constans TaxID=2565781 RepID=A0A5Q0UG55_9ARCH|nr:hypothetical protein [Candidatus Nanohalobium constans]QGA79969.1 hypothetical protein LC1Nh_0061 [Candidatus Nanohalobium constans]
MKKLLTLLLIGVLLAATGLAQSQDTKTSQNNGFAVFNPFSAVENFVEKAEVSLAGAIGGPDLKAKALANNAEESLEKAEKLANGNKTEKIEK